MTSKKEIRKKFIKKYFEQEEEQFTFGHIITLLGISIGCAMIFGAVFFVLRIFVLVFF